MLYYVYGAKMVDVFKGFNIVIFAKNHNPTIVSKDWLTEKGMLKEKVNNFAQTPVFSIIETDNYDLIVDPEKLILTSKDSSDEKIKRILDISKVYSERLTEIPYKNLEMRYIFEIDSNENHLKELFSKNDNLFKSIFGEKYEISGIIQSELDRFTYNVRFLKFKEKVIGDFCYNFKIENYKDIGAGLAQYPKLIKKSQDIIKGLF